MRAAASDDMPEDEVLQGQHAVFASVGLSLSLPNNLLTLGLSFATPATSAESMVDAARAKRPGSEIKPALMNSFPERAKRADRSFVCGGSEGWSGVWYRMC